MASNMQAFFFRDFENAYIPHILKEIYIDQIYRPFLHGKKDLVIADVGANIGLFSYYASQFAQKVYALEPSQSHIEEMTEMAKYNKLEMIKPVKKALAAENGTAKFYHNPNSTMFSLNPTVNDHDDFEEVETITLESFMSENNIDHIDMMKLDVEGSESEIIVSDGFKKMAPKVDMIIGEWHTWGKMSQSVFASAFRDMGYEFDWMGNTEASVFSAVRV